MSLGSFKKDLEGDLKKRFQKAGYFLQKTCREKCNTSQEYQRYTGGHGVSYKGFDPSKAGAYPHKLSSQLVKSITFFVGDDYMIFGSNLEGHPAFLQLGTRYIASRPWLQLTWTDCEAGVAAIMTK